MVLNVIRGKHLGGAWRWLCVDMLLILLPNDILLFFCFQMDAVVDECRSFAIWLQARVWHRNHVGHPSRWPEVRFRWGVHPWWSSSISLWHSISWFPPEACGGLEGRLHCLAVDVLLLVWQILEGGVRGSLIKPLAPQESALSPMIFNIYVKLDVREPLGLGGI